MTSDPPRVVIAADATELHYWRDLWRYRELFGVLAWRDVAVRYKQTLIGVAWAVVRPLVALGVFSAVFGRLARMPTEGTSPYPLLVFTGLLPWQFFATATTDASNSMLANAGLVGKVYFPRMIVPAAAVVVALADFLVSLVLLLVLMAAYGIAPSVRILALPAFAALAFLASVGPGLWLSAQSAKYRDFRHLVPFLVQIGMYVSPVGFSSTAVPERWRGLFALNPLVAVIDGFRWAILPGARALDVRTLSTGCAIIALTLLLGMHRFRRVEKSFADLL